MTLELRRKVYLAIANQRAVAERWRTDPLRAPSSWKDVVAAALYASRAIGRIPDLPDETRWLELVIGALVAAREEFRSEEEDPDGYGSATLAEITSEVIGLRPPPRVP
jgi:hypothetical protein